MNRPLKRASLFVIFLVPLLVAIMMPITVKAAAPGIENMKQAEQYVDKALEAAEQGKLTGAEKIYEQFRSQWLKIEDTVKPDSGQAYKDIESNMGQVEYAFLQNKQQQIVKALQGLKDVNGKYFAGHYAKGSGFQQEDITLSDFIGLLKDTVSKVQSHDKEAAVQEINKVQESWLSVEGTVVAQSASVYNDSERDMATVSAMIQGGDFNGAEKLLNTMIVYLIPLAGITNYTMWDAAMIPIREGLEALLVVASLLAFVKKSNQGKGKGWIWSGVTAGLLVSTILAIIVKLVFSSGSFGKNNFLIGGYTGVFAAVMLLYMSYWLHSKSNVKEWNRYIHEKSSSALATGSLISLGFLSFLSVFREGTETVMFFIGMVNQISMQNLLTGIIVGFGVLAVVAYFILFVGMRLPIRPFFLVSSLIVFYLCLKFTGLGIHSLQLAGVLSNDASSTLPSIDFIGFFPSWESAVPQITLVLAALAVLGWQRISGGHKTAPAS